MEPMTPEERFIKIENAIEALIESRARHDTQIAALTGHMEGQNALIEKQNAGIRDLIVVSRTLVDSQKAAFEAIDRLSEKVDRLIDNIDKLIRGRGPNGHLQ